MNYQPEKVSKYVQDTKKTVGLKEDKKMPNPYYVVVENFDPLNFYFFFLFFPFLPIVVFKGQFTAQFPAILGPVFSLFVCKLRVFFGVQQRVIQRAAVRKTHQSP